MIIANYQFYLERRSLKKKLKCKCRNITFIAMKT